MVLVPAYPNVPLWVWYIFGLLGLANSVFIIFLFMWKKWAFFAVCGTAIIAFIMDLLIIQEISLPSFVSLIPTPILLYFFMRPKWDLFK